MKMLLTQSHLQFLLRLFLPLLLASPQLPVIAQDLQRGLRNYQEVLAGRKKLEQLTPLEQQEVIIVFRRIRSAQSATGNTRACRDARERVESAASELADRARKLRSCAESQNYSDDCSSEFRRVRNAQHDYESAVSDIQSECNQ